MIHALRICLLLWLAVLLPNMACAHEASQQKEIIKATLVSEYSGITPGKPFMAGVLLEPKPGWHTYWENPGDAGMATSFAWTLPLGFSAGNIDWPTPQRLTEGPLVTFSYEGSVFLPVTITPPAVIESAAPLALTVKAEWLVCKDICIPESAELSIPVPVAKDAPPTEYAPLFENHRKLRPQPIAAAHYRLEDKTVVLSVALDGLHMQDIHSAVFFPRQQNLINYAAEPKFTASGDALTLTLERGDDGKTPVPPSLSGILSVAANGGEQKSFEVTFSPGAPQAAASGNLASVLLLAVLGGLILNLMPCVLPVLSLKALAIAKKSGHEHAVVIRLGVAYTLGVLASFAVIAGILIALRQGGEAIGWGYQMQSPAFVCFLIYLLFMVGLNLSGLFHLPVLLGNAGGEIANESSVRGSFFTGILATAVATPCTAPFMASAVGIALTLPPLQSMLVFEALGFGLALPFLLVSLFPALLRFLPKPGAWMDTFKQFLAFPMYASVIWLLWVLVLQTGAGGMVIALCGMLGIIAVLWMKSLFAEGSAAYHTVALACLALILALSLPGLGHMEADSAALPGGHAGPGVETVAYSKEKLAELRAAGKPVYIDATAAWCLTCQVNARIALDTPRAMDAFKQQGVILMIADWTRRNDDITDFLSGFGYKGVPLNVFYPAGGGDPIVLPQLLTEDKVITTITGKGD